MSPVGYNFIPVFVSIVLGLHHVAFTDASRGSKLTVFGIVAVSLAIWLYGPRWLVFATLMQAGVSIYMLLYLRWQYDAV